MTLGTTTHREGRMSTVLALCNRTINMVRPWLENGYRAVTVDIQPADEQTRGREHVVRSILDIEAEWVAALRPAIVFAFPPCTHLAVSGSRHFQAKGMAKLIEALSLVEKCRELCEASGAPYMIENPVSTLSTYWREPDYSFDPSDYGDPYTKRTCLWTGGGFVMPPKIHPGDLFETPTVVPATEGSKMHRLPPSKERADLRAVTPQGFAWAVFRANHKRLEKAA